MEQLSTKIHPKKERKIKILQFGEGNFLRAFVDWIIQQMNNTGVFEGSVAVVQPVNMGRIEAMKEQDGLYTLFLQGLQNGEKVFKSEIIDVIDDLINPYTDYDKYLAYAKSEDLQFVISNTTEAGIVLDPNDTNLDSTPNSYPGKLLAFLKARYDFFKGDMKKGLNIIPCELIDYNGKKLKEIMVELANINGLSKEFINWLENANTYSNTLVDRIVPGYPRDEADKLQEELGYKDHSMVKGEIFHLWVIEGPQGLNEIFPADKAGLNVLFVDNFKPYKERKVKILNGSHTCMVPVAYLYGIDTVRETVEHEKLGKFVKEFIYDEVVPTINLPKDQMEFFASSVLERYMNPFVRHELMSISLNSMTKFKTRILPTILDNVNNLHVFPKRAFYSLAAWMVFYKGERNGEAIKLADDQVFLDMWKDLWSKFDGTKEGVKNIVTYVLGLENHWETNINNIEGATDYVTDAVYDILTNGMVKSFEKYFG